MNYGITISTVSETTLLAPQTSFLVSKDSFPIFIYSDLYGTKLEVAEAMFPFSSGKRRLQMSMIQPDKDIVHGDSEVTF